MTCVVVQFQKRRKKNQSTLTGTKFWCSIAPEDKKQKENETPKLLHRARNICFSWIDVDDQLMIILSAILFLYRTFNHFENFKTERMSAIVQNYGGNPNEVYSIFVFRISLANSTNFSFIESSRHALSSSTTAPSKTHTQ